MSKANKIDDTVKSDDGSLIVRRKMDEKNGKMIGGEQLAITDSGKLEAAMVTDDNDPEKKWGFSSGTSESPLFTAKSEGVRTVVRIDGSRKEYKKTGGSLEEFSYGKSADSIETLEMQFFVERDSAGNIIGYHASYGSPSVRPIGAPQPVTYYAQYDVSGKLIKARVGGQWIDLTNPELYVAVLSTILGTNPVEAYKEANSIRDSVIGALASDKDLPQMLADIKNTGVAIADKNGDGKLTLSDIQSPIQNDITAREQSAARGA